MNNGYYFGYWKKNSVKYTHNKPNKSRSPSGHQLTIMRIIWLLKQLELVVEYHDNTNIHIVTLTLIAQLYFNCLTLTHSVKHSRYRQFHVF